MNGGPGLSTNFTVRLDYLRSGREQGAGWTFFLFFNQDVVAIRRASGTPLAFG
jgi:hypothetical protein